jgi:hypothetical protein
MPNSMSPQTPSSETGATFDAYKVGDEHAQDSAMALEQVAPAQPEGAFKLPIDGGVGSAEFTAPAVEPMATEVPPFDAPEASVTPAILPLEQGPEATPAVTPLTEGPEEAPGDSVEALPAFEPAPEPEMFATESEKPSEPLVQSETVTPLEITDELEGAEPESPESVEAPAEDVDAKLEAWKNAKAEEKRLGEAVVQTIRDEIARMDANQENEAKAQAEAHKAFLKSHDLYKENRELMIEKLHETEKAVGMKKSEIEEEGDLKAKVIPLKNQTEQAAA